MTATHAHKHEPQTPHPTPQTLLDPHPSDPFAAISSKQTDWTRKTPYIPVKTCFGATSR